MNYIYKSVFISNEIMKARVREKKRHIATLCTYVFNTLTMTNSKILVYIYLFLFWVLWTLKI